MLKYCCDLCGADRQEKEKFPIEKPASDGKVLKFSVQAIYKDGNNEYYGNTAFICNKCAILELQKLDEIPRSTS